MLGVISLPITLASVHKFHVRWWDESGYCVAGQFSTIRIIAMKKKKKSNTGFVSLRKILMILCEALFMIHLKSIRTIALVGSFRGIFDVHRVSHWMLV